MLLDLSYLSYPLPPDIQRLYEAGDFARMDPACGSMIRACPRR